MNSYQVLQDMFESIPEQDKDVLMQEKDQMSNYAKLDELVNAFPSRLSLWLFDNGTVVSDINDDQIKDLLMIMRERLISYDSIFGQEVGHKPTILANIMFFLRILIQVANKLGLEGKFDFDSAQDIMQEELEKEFAMDTIDYKTLEKLYTTILSLM